MASRSSFSLGIGLVALFWANTLSITSAFSHPKAFVSTRIGINPSALGSTADMHRFKVQSSSSLQLFPAGSYSSLLLTDDAAAIASANASLELLRNVFIGIGGIVVFLIAFTFITATFVVPAAAKSLEEDTRRLRPGLWEEYEAKLNEGETMAQRPDLLQELGKIMQPVILNEFDKVGNEGAAPTTPPASTTTAPKVLKVDDQWSD